MKGADTSIVQLGRGSGTGNEASCQPYPVTYGISRLWLGVKVVIAFLDKLRVLEGLYEDQLDIIQL